MQNSFVKIVSNKKELTIKDVARNKTTIRRDNSFSNMEMFFKSLDEENLDFTKYQVGFVSGESMHAF